MSLGISRPPLPLGNGFQIKLRIPQISCCSRYSIGIEQENRGSVF